MTWLATHLIDRLRYIITYLSVVAMVMIYGCMQIEHKPRYYYPSRLPSTYQRMQLAPNNHNPVVTCLRGGITGLPRIPCMLLSLSYQSICACSFD